jgi:hypothetical protein
VPTVRSDRSGGTIGRSLGAMAAWLLLGSTCVTLSPEAQRVTTGLVGIDARIIRKCLGDTVYLDIREDGSEVWAFAFATPEVAADVEVRRVTGQGTAYARPAVESGSPTERRNAGEAISRLREGRVEAGQCLHVFTMVDGSVRQYFGRGRSAAGLNADSICISLIAPCVPPVPANPAAQR